MPKRMRSTLASLDVRPLSDSRIVCRNPSKLAYSAGAWVFRSSMKSPRWESSSSPMGVSMEMGSLAILSTLRTFSSGMSIFSASSSGVGSRPCSCSICREMRFSLLMVSIMCTGMRIVLAWSAMERVMAWRIHQVAYVENLYPRRYSNLSTAFMRPILPSCIRSRNSSPRLVYFFAMEMTRRRLASTISFFALRIFASPMEIFLLTSLISAMVSRLSLSASASLCCILITSSLTRARASA